MAPVNSSIASDDDAAAAATPSSAAVIRAVTSTDNDSAFERNVAANATIAVRCSLTSRATGSWSPTAPISASIAR